MQKNKTLKLWAQLQAQGEAMWSHLETYSEAERQARPAQGGWSAAQIMQHLYMAEKGSWQSVQQRIAKGEPLRKGTGRHWRRAVKLTLFLRLPARYKAPDVVGTQAIDEALQKFAGTAELIQHWQNFRQNTKNELQGLDEQYFDATLYRHPIIGYLTLPGMVRFLYEHQRRHFKQMRRALPNR